MLPNNPYRPIRPSHRPRPISAGESTLTTGLLNNPNGTYVSNPYPTTAQNGAQGQYGAMLPQVQVSPSTLNEPWRNYNPAAYGANAGNPNLQNVRLNLNPFALPPGNRNEDFAARLPGQAGSIIPNPANYDPRRGRGYQAPYEGSGRSGQEYQSGGTGEPGDFDDFFMRDKARETSVMNAVLTGLDAGDMSVISMLPPGDLEAMGLGDLAATAGGTSPATEPTDFQQTAAYKYNTANNIPLMQQKRWDEKRRKYITVGQWMKQENKKYNKKGRRRSGRRATAPAAQGNANYTLETEGNFNTATG